MNVCPLDARDSKLLDLQRQLLGVLQSHHIRTAPEGRSYRRPEPSLLERFDAAARAIADDPPDVRKHQEELLEAGREIDATPARPSVSVTDIVDDPAKRFGNAEACERGAGLHRHLRDFFAEGGARGPQQFEIHPLYGDYEVNAELALEHLGLTPLVVESPLVAVGPDGQEIFGTADVIAANESRRLVVVDWSISDARAPKLVQVAGYLSLLSWMWVSHRLEPPPGAGGYVVGLGRDFDPGLLSCLRPVEPLHVRQFLGLLQRDGAR